MLLFSQVQKHNLSGHDSCCRNSQSLKFASITAPASSKNLGTLLKWQKPNSDNLPKMMKMMMMKKKKKKKTKKMMMRRRRMRIIPELRNWRKDLTTRRVRGESVLKLFISISCLLPFLVLSRLILYCIKVSRSATSSPSTSYQVIPSATIIRSLLVATTVLLEIAQSKQFSSLSISISILIPFFCSVLFSSLLFCSLLFCSVLFCSLFSPLFVSSCDFVFHQSPNHSFG